MKFKKQVRELKKNGLTTSEIAEKLSCSSSTVYNCLNPKKYKEHRLKRAEKLKTDPAVRQKWNEYHNEYRRKRKETDPEYRERVNRLARLATRRRKQRNKRKKK